MINHEPSALFRGKRLNNEEWVYGNLIIRRNRYYIATNDNLDFMKVANDGMASLRLIEVIPESVGGYSSVNDRNDIKVFAGDIIESIVDDESGFLEECRAIVIFDKGAYYGDGPTNIETYEFKDCAVIGNLFDNEELVEDLYDEN